jgi:phosphonate transport system ATP-binding protein
MIRAQNLSVVFPPAFRALNSVNLEFKRGSFVVLLGRSGAGKTTLLRCLAHLIKPTTGRVIVDGFGDLESAETLRKWRTQTSFIFQLHQLILRQTALKNVLLGRLGYMSTLRSLLPFSDDDERLALQCLDRVGLLEKAHSRADKLSGGQRQRVGIARALCQQAQLILADEPVASLDPVTARDVLTLLDTVRKADGLTAIVSLHQVELAREYGERVIGMANGDVVFDGSPADLNDDALQKIYPGGVAASAMDRAQQPPAATYIFGCSGATIRHPEG